MKRYCLLLTFLLSFSTTYAIYFKHIGMGEGLSQTSVLSIYQDQLGRMWFGTGEGISLYDGNRMTVFKVQSEDDPTSTTNVLAGNIIEHLCGNQTGDVFFKADGALMRYDLRKQSFHTLRQTGTRVVTASDGDIWCVVNDSLFTYDAAEDSLQFRYKTDLPSITCLLIDRANYWIGNTSGVYLKEGDKPLRCVLSGSEIYRLFKSRSKDIWVGCRMDGLYRIKPDGEMTKIPSHLLISDHIREFVEDNDGNLWFGTFKGLQQYNPYTNTFSFSKREQLPGGLSHSSVYSLCIDRQGTIWVGTYYGGVNYFNTESDFFTHYTDNPERTDCLSYPFVGHMTEDKDGRVWICTEGGGLNELDRKTQTFRHYMAGGPRTLAHNNLKSICYDEQLNRLYIGTHTGGLSRYDLSTGVFYNYLNDYRTGDKKPNNVVLQTTLYRDKLYVSAWSGIFAMDLKTGGFECLFDYQHPAFHNFMIDSKGYIWLATNREVIRMRLDDWDDITHIPLAEHQLRFKITRMLENRHGIYMGTLGSGLFRYDEASGTFTQYTVKGDHLLSNYCYEIAETTTGNLLITSDKGLTFFNPETESSQFVKLGQTLPITSIVEGCGVLVCRNGDIFVGGADGLVSFREEDLNLVHKDYSIYFSNLYLNNEQVFPDDHTDILQEAFPFTQQLQLSYKQNNLIFQFTTSNYIDIQNSSEYEYQLVGFDDDWRSTSLASIYYTNLNPGTYQLYVREKDTPKNGLLHHEAIVKVVINQPWYNTILAWMIYFFLTASAGFILIRTWRARRELTLSLQREREEKERNEELNQAKLRFFTNISHEFRTPLTLIISQIDLLFQSTSLSPTVYNRVIKISKQANQMRNLITELLSFRKFEQNYISLHVAQQPIVYFLKDIYYSFYELSIQRQITYTFNDDTHNPMLWMDDSQMQKVVYNLLSNAFKFTRDRGTIQLNLSEDDEAVWIKVLDNGFGLTAEEKKRVFDCFYQAEGREQSRPTPGTGIGLALSQSIVSAHHGEISVESSPGYGSVFIVKLWKGKAHFEQDTKVVFSEQTERMAVEADSLPDASFMATYVEKGFPELSEGARYTVLLVEDNPELLETLHNLFAPLYNVLTACNGEEGLQIASAEKPDLIVTDVMMPVMTGTEMCMQIKNNIDLCHIPVVVLTALTSVEHNVEGLQQGADDYIGKPFHAKILLMRCNNLIRNRLLMQHKLSSQPNLDVSLVATNPLDRKLMDQVAQIIDQYLDDAAFDINRLAKELAMGRSSLYAKFKSLTGMTPNDFIQSYRLKKAAVLLREQPDIQVSEVADRLGFGSSVYFSRCFKSQFGESPSQFRNQQG